MTQGISEAPDLTGGWELAKTLPGAAEKPSELSRLELDWLPAAAPGTVAETLASLAKRPLAEIAGDWSHLGDLDRYDWWYRCPLEPAPDGGSVSLRADGLATLATIWLGDVEVLASRNMFVSHLIDLPRPAGREPCRMHIRFASLAAALAQRQERPRWRAPLVSDQGLRWQRTSLLGRMPGWPPPLAPVGPWRDLLVAPRPRIEVGRPVSRLADDHAEVEIVVRIHKPGLSEIAAEARVGTTTAAIEFDRSDSDCAVGSARVTVPDAPRWWPHTHGEPARLPVEIQLDFDGRRQRFSAGHAAFRSVTLASDTDGPFRFRLNDTDVFCRGACWSPLSITRLHVSAEEYRAALEAVRDAGFNMLRVSGTTVYEHDAFYELCDELGILVWQDLMLANLDYPIDDEGFWESLEEELTQLLARLAGRPSVSLLCGGSETEQQPAMLGWPEKVWGGSAARGRFAGLVSALLPDVPYWPSSPSGGALPFRCDEGDVHYWGVGAYRRPPSDLRLARVAFASECLAFSNIPEDETLDLIFGTEKVTSQHPTWKARSPRDMGAAWDFDDVRDHYLAQLFGLDATELRSTDPTRYLELSRVVPGELMAMAFAEWRRPGSGCGGGLVWLFQDPWPAPGWGIRDSLGRPKAAFFYLRRAFAPRLCNFIDEGLNGLRLYVANDSSQPLDARVEVALDRFAGGYRHTISTSLSVRPHGEETLDLELLTGRFGDPTYAYRFGPAAAEIVSAALMDAADDTPIAEAFHLPLGFPRGAEVSSGLTGSLARPDPAGSELILELTAERFAQSVAITGPFRVEDNFFHLAPGASRSIRLASEAPPSEPVEATVKPVNAEAPLVVAWRPEGE